MTGSTLDYRKEITAAATAAGIPPAIALRVAQQESGTQQHDAQGRVKVSRAGAVGIMQVMPSTAPGVDLTDARANIAAGVRYLREMFDRFGNWSLAVAAYNAGPGRVQEMLQGKRQLPAETKSYVAAISTGGGIGPELFYSRRPAGPMPAAPAVAGMSGVTLLVLAAAAVLLFFTAQR